MIEFEDFDIRRWLRDGLLERITHRERLFERKQRSGLTRASVALSLIASVGMLEYEAPACASQVQSQWPTTVQGLSQRAVPPDLSLVPGRPEQYWSELTQRISQWDDVKESESVDVPPLL
jgi:hypothetical protein